MSDPPLKQLDPTAEQSDGENSYYEHGHNTPVQTQIGPIHF